MKMLDLIDPSFLRRLQSMFSSYLGTSLMITDVNGTPLIEPISGVRMCSLIRNTARGEVICETSDRNGGHETLLSKKTHVYRCMAGFLDFSAAIVFRDEVIGLLVGGQVKTGDEDTGRLGDISKETGVAQDALESAYREMPCVSERQLKEKLAFIKQSMEYLCDLAYGYYERHLIDMKKVADADARVQAAEGVTEMFNRHLKELSDAVMNTEGMDEGQESIRAELEEMIRQSGSSADRIGDGPEYQGHVDKDYRIREVTYELQWVLKRVSAPYGDRVRVPDEIDRHIPPYLCGDPAAISEVLGRILAFISKKDPGSDIFITVNVQKDQYAALLEISVISPGWILSGEITDKVENALSGEWEGLVGTGDLDYLELTTAAAVSKKLSAELSCRNMGPQGLCFEFAIPQLPAKGGFY